MPAIPIITPEQSADWDRRAVAAGTDLRTLMESAGRAAATVLAARFPERLRQGVLVAAGTGNNGGDAWVVARALQRADVPVWVAPLAGEGSPLQREVSAIALSEGMRTVAPDGPWPNVGLLVDGILGTGAKGAPRPPAAQLVERLNDLTLPIVALDGPTGVDLRTGACHGSVVHAALSITFGGVRRGHLLAREEVGDLVVVDIGLSLPAVDWPLLVTDQLAADWLPPFRAENHKGVRGRVVVVGGDAGMTGAVRLAARAAFAAGAGLVHAVAPAATVEALTAAEPDLQTFADDFGTPLSVGLQQLLTRADAVVIGPGLGRAAGRVEFVLAVLAQARCGVVDADGLVVLQGRLDGLAALGAGRPLVLTPHPGEFRTLFPSLASGLESDPWTTAAEASASAGATILLKGVPSVIARAGRAAHTVAAGNPGLATGGSGDVLSGFIGTMLAQGLDPHIAAALGAQALGRAADLAARRVTARGLRPMDVIAALPDLWRSWRTLRECRPPARPPILLELDAPERT
ncbi:MAG TPA: NAD(P)H-hydrate dehydratase [Streptosporangiaceae bacterium]|nr:NAD(P)H-hydrate dehydratase [Streptosporangiaceae bacterium]